MYFNAISFGQFVPNVISGLDSLNFPLPLSDEKWRTDGASNWEGKLAKDANVFKSSSSNLLNLLQIFHEPNYLCELNLKQTSHK